MNKKKLTHKIMPAFFFLLLLSIWNTALVQGQETQMQSAAKHVYSGGWHAIMMDDYVQLRLENKMVPNDSISVAISLTDINGLIMGKRSAFSVTRDAGTMRFEGIVKDGEGEGTYRFTPNASFAEQLKDENLDVSESDQFNFFLTNVTKLYVKMLKKHGYGQLKKAELLRLGEQGVGKKQTFQQQDEPAPPPVDTSALGHLINFKLVGITEAYIKSFEDAGYRDIEPGTMINFKSVGVTPDYIRSFAFTDLKPATYSDIINFKLTGVTPAYIRSFIQAGYTDISYSMIVNLKAAGVPPPQKDPK